MKTLTKAEALLLDLFKARAAAKAEKARFAHMVALRGGWRCQPDYHAEDEIGVTESGIVKEACWHSPNRPKCADCRVLGPYHARYRKAAAKAGGALRRVTKEGERLFFANH